MADNTLSGLGDETLANAQSIKTSVDSIKNSVLETNRALGTQGQTTKYIRDTFTNISDSVDKVSKIQAEALKTSKATGKALEEQAKQSNIVRKLNAEIDELYTRSNVETGVIRDNLKRQAVNLSNARDNAKDLGRIYGNIARDASQLDKQTKFFSGLSDISKKVPILNKFSTPFEKAAEAARKTALNNAKVVQQQKDLKQLTSNELSSGIGLTRKRLQETGLTSITGDSVGTVAAKKLRDHEASLKTASITGAGTSAGISEMVKGLTSAVGMFTIFSTIAKFVWDILAGIQANTVAISKNLGITQTSADKIRLHFVEIAASSSNILVNSKSLIEAQKSLVDSLGFYTKLQDSTLTNQVFLTENLKLSADEAANLNLVFEAQGQSAEKVTSNINYFNNAAAKASGAMLPFSKLMAAVAKTSFEIKGYFKFNNQAIAEGVRQVSRYGLELENAKSISKSLLDFESSIGNELTLELLTGKEFNLEKARTKALTGDIAGATSEVMKQMQGLTEEQRKNPLIMESMAAMSGLTADQLNRAYLVNKKLTNEQKNYVDALSQAGKAKEANQATDMAITGQSIEQIKRTMTAQDAFNAALDKLKDQLTRLAGNGILEKLTNVIIAFVTTVTGPSGFRGLFTGDFTENLNKGEKADKLKAEASLLIPRNATKEQQLTAEKLVASREGPAVHRSTYQSYKERARVEGILTKRELYAAVSEGTAHISETGTVVRDRERLTPTETVAYWDKFLDLQQKQLDAQNAGKHTSIYIGASSVAEALGVYSNKMGV